MFEVLSLVVASAGSCLVEEAPVGPVVGVSFGVGWVGEDGPEPPDFVTGQRDQLI